MKITALLTLFLVSGVFAREGYSLTCVNAVQNGQANEGVQETSPVIHKNAVLRIMGGVLFVGGSLLAYHFNSKSERAYSDYQKSAFTQNTAGLRNDVKSYDRGKIISVGAAGVGLFMIVLSF